MFIYQLYNEKIHIFKLMLRILKLYGKIYSIVSFNIIQYGMYFF
jgi:hypothetical protein